MALPAYGRRLLPHVLDRYAQTDPNRVYASCVSLENNNLFFRNYTVSDLAKATNACAWWMKDNIGNGDNFETLAFFGIADLRYTMICIAGIKCGFTILLLGPRNTANQNQSLLKRTACTKLVYTKELANTAQQLRQLEPELCITELPSIDDLLLSINDTQFPYIKSFDEAENDPVLHLHSSGSTGDPKITTMTNGSFAVTDNDRNIPTPAGRQAQNASQFNSEHGCRFYTCFPPYHLAGVQSYLILPMFYSNTTLVLGPPEIPPTGQLVVDIIRQSQDLNAFYVPASTVEQWACTEEGMLQSTQLDFILYGGGALPLEIGDKLNQHTNVRQMYGSVEVGQVQTLIPQKDEWSYIEWNPYEEVYMRPNGDDGLCEVVLHQSPKFRQSRALSHNFPDIKEWRMGDLFIPHPTKAGLWKYYSREDDAIVLSSGHKVNPAGIESELRAHPQVSAVLVVGTGRPQPAVLLEIIPCESRQLTDIETEIWSMLKSVNQNLPEYARLSRSRVIFSDPAIPFPRTPKGSIMRKETINLYSTAIQSVYDNQDYEILLKGTSADEITEFVREAMNVVLDYNSIQDTKSLFDVGLDSTKVFDVLNILQNGLQRRKPIDKSIFQPKLIYQNSTIQHLSLALQAVIHDNNVESQMTPRNQADINQLVDLYTNGLPNAKPLGPSVVPVSSPYTVLLTGSTGSLGSEVLNDLILHPTVAKVYCFIRKKRALTTNPSSKVVDIIVTFSQARFGLSDDLYRSLLSEVNVIVSLAWKVDFNLELRDFEYDCIRSIRSFVDFSLESKLRPCIIFASSTAYALHHALASRDSTVEEDILPRSNLNGISGYVQSKEVGEQILAVSSRHLNVPVSIVRLGQIADKDTIKDKSSWPEQEWLPSLVRTSKLLGLIPDIGILVDWVPINRVSHMLIDLINASQTTEGFPLLEVYNVVHPHPIPWSRFAQTILELSPGSRIVPLRGWIDAVKSHCEKPDSIITTVPAIKLIQFFEYLDFLQRNYAAVTQITISVSKVMSRSKVLRDLPPLDDRLLKKWASL